VAPVRTAETVIDWPAGIVVGDTNEVEIEIDDDCIWVTVNVVQELLTGPALFLSPL
jgi:hypothetical protein